MVSRKITELLNGLALNPAPPERHHAICEVKSEEGAGEGDPRASTFLRRVERGSLQLFRHRITELRLSLNA